MEIGEPVKILIVDDEEIMRNSLRDILQDVGYRVTTASDGEEAIGLSAKERFHVAVVDLKMPRISGIDVLRAIKKENDNTDVIMMTGYASVETAVESMKLGAMDYLTKPFDMDQIIMIIQQAVQKQKKG